MSQSGESIFRQQALDHFAAQRIRGQVLRVSPIWLGGTYWLLLLLIAALPFAATRVHATPHLTVTGIAGSCNTSRNSCIYFDLTKEQSTLLRPGALMRVRLPSTGKLVSLQLDARSLSPAVPSSTSDQIRVGQDIGAPLIDIPRNSETRVSVDIELPGTSIARLLWESAIGRKHHAQ